MFLQVSNLSKKYGNQQVLNNISFDVSKGEIIGLLGPNGAGKSTTMKIIAGCLVPDAGCVLIEGFNMSEDDLEAKSKIGYLPENNPLYEEMYVAEYLEYVAKIYIKKRTVKERIKEVIELTGLQKEARKTINQLSKGYRQRVGLAQAIIHNPDLLILDEPTSGLDPNQTEEIKGLLLELGKKKVILFSSHTLSEVESICSRVIIIHKGNIVADMPTHETDNLDTLFKTLTKE